jgi:hypothetical protein
MPEINDKMVTEFCLFLIVSPLILWYNTREERTALAGARRLTPRIRTPQGAGERRGGEN